MTEMDSSSFLVKALEMARSWIMTYWNRRVGPRRQRLAFRGHAKDRPDPNLSETHAKVIALSYGMQGGKAKIRVRRAILYYALRRLGLDTDPTAKRPKDQQIVLLNRDQISQSAQGIMQ